jgi:hypothetical protein
MARMPGHGTPHERPQAHRHGRPGRPRRRPGWRQDRAVALESEARVIAGGLLELANVEELFAARRNDKTCAEIRQLAGRLTSST